MIEEHRAPLGHLARGLVESEELDRLEIAAALGEPRPRARALPQPGPRPEPALRPQQVTTQPASTARRPLRRIAPALAAALAAFAARADRDRSAPIA
jgi:hypothetical protein